MRPQDLFGASPKTVLNKPFFHAQDQKAYNVDGGTSIAGAWTKRTLNTVMANDIQGASLANDAVSLPAGTYYVEGKFSYTGNSGSAYNVLAGAFKDGVKQIQGENITNINTEAGSTANVSGVITLSTPGAIDLRYYVGLAKASNGLGTSNNSGSITDPTIQSVYADLKIWQLDRSLEIAPVAVNSGLQNIPGVNTQDNIDGLDITTSGQVITVTKGSCMNSTRDTVMALTANATWTVAGTNNLETYLFLVRLVADGSFTVKGYSTYAGPSSDPLVDKWRLIHWNKNNGSGVLMPCRQVGDRIDWLTSNRPILTSSLSASYVLYPVSSVLPSSLINSVSIIGVGNTIMISNDGTTDIIGGGSASASGATVSSYGVYLKYANASIPVHIIDAMLRR